MLYRALSWVLWRSSSGALLLPLLAVALSQGSPWPSVAPSTLFLVESPCSFRWPKPSSLLSYPSLTPGKHMWIFAPPYSPSAGQFQCSPLHSATNGSSGQPAAHILTVSGTDRSPPDSVLQSPEYTYQALWDLKPISCGLGCKQLPTPFPLSTGKRTEMPQPIK